MKDRPRVLFVCTHNAARSQMAEAILRQVAGDQFEACSAGFAPTEVHPLTIRALTEIGVDTKGLRAKAVRDFLGKEAVKYAVIVCQQDEESCPRVYLFATRTLYWAFDDPSAAPGTPDDQLAAFRRVRDEIDCRIREWVRGTQ
jgi:arsenate reductase (thioredoxin)